MHIYTPGKHSLKNQKENIAKWAKATSGIERKCRFDDKKWVWPTFFSHYKTKRRFFQKSGNVVPCKDDEASRKTRFRILNMEIVPARTFFPANNDACFLTKLSFRLNFVLWLLLQIIYMLRVNRVPVACDCCTDFGWCNVYLNDLCPFFKRCKSERACCGAKS